MTTRPPALPLPILLSILTAISACTTTHKVFRFSGPDMEAGFYDWRATAPPKTRAMIEALEWDETIVIHLIRGKINPNDSRGGASCPASNRYCREVCLLHPPMDGIAFNRNWDVVYDQTLQETEENKTGFPSPLSALLQHEIMGHVVPGLFDPSRAITRSLEDEDHAIRQENDYRQYLGLPLMPRGKRGVDVWLK